MRLYRFGEISQTVQVQVQVNIKYKLLCLKVLRLSDFSTMYHNGRCMVLKHGRFGQQIRKIWVAC
jgi:hypothetical protein